MASPVNLLGTEASQPGGARARDRATCLYQQMDSFVPGLQSEHIEVSMRADVLIAQNLARSFAERLGFQRRGQWEIATAVSEAATNILAHGVRGTITFYDCHDDPQRMEFVATDHGAGIGDVGRALVDGVSNGRPHLPGSGVIRAGLGCGLGAISRLMDGLTISTSPSGGTILRAHKRACGRIPGVVEKTQARRPW